jgi:hypothetical protein
MKIGLADLKSVRALSFDKMEPDYFGQNIYEVKKILIVTNRE